VLSTFNNKSYNKISYSIIHGTKVVTDGHTIKNSASGLSDDIEALW